MVRDYLTSKWILAGAAFLILFAGACFWWYQHQLAPYKQEVTKTAESARQWQTKKATPSDPVETASPDKLAESTPMTADKSITETVEAKTNIGTDTENAKRVPLEAEKKDKPQQRVSKFGLGPFPPLPPDFPRKRWRNHYDLIGELMERVEVKLWKQGIRDIKGIGYDHNSGLIHLNRPNVVYVDYEFTETEDEINRYLHVSGSPISEEDVELLRQGKPIPGLTVLKMSDGIEPYRFLNLKK